MSDTSLQNNHLSIEFGGGFSFVGVYSQPSGECRQVHRLFPATGERDCASVLLHLPELLNEPGSVSFSYCHSAFVLLPNAYYDPTQNREMLGLNTNLHPEDAVHSMDLPGFDARLVYAADEELEKKLAKRFPRYQRGHCAAFLLSYYRRFAKEGQQIFLHFYPEFFFLTIFRNQQLIMINAFPWKDPDDVLYFTLFCCEQHRFDPAHTRFLVSGILTENDTTFLQLKKYTGTISILNAETNATVKDRSQITLSEQFRCVS